mmetsp:Transcript_16967/g.53472  ORF Transcript_16967/g.53472 Transcript_16967/m.53472 type:complete len:255 (-) Transcript_16967:170-934(-)
MASTFSGCVPWKPCSSSGARPRAACTSWRLSWKPKLRRGLSTDHAARTLPWPPRSCQSWRTAASSPGAQGARLTPAAGGAPGPRALGHWAGRHSAQRGRPCTQASQAWSIACARWAVSTMQEQCQSTPLPMVHLGAGTAGALPPPHCLQDAATGMRRRQRRQSCSSRASRRPSRPLPCGPSGPMRRRSSAKSFCGTRCSRTATASAASASAHNASWPSTPACTPSLPKQGATAACRPSGIRHRPLPPSRATTSR